MDERGLWVSLVCQPSCMFKGEIQNTLITLQHLSLYGDIGIYEVDWRKINVLGRICSSVIIVAKVTLSFCAEALA